MANPPCPLSETPIDKGEERGRDAGESATQTNQPGLKMTELHTKGSRVHSENTLPYLNIQAKSTRDDRIAVKKTLSEQAGIV